MKKNYLTIFSSLLFISLNAQITLTSASFPQNGENFLYIRDQQSTFSLQPGGANQTWDLSGVTNTSTYTETFTDVSAGTDPSLFPQANALKIDLAERYFTLSANDYSLVGVHAPGQYTMTFQDSYEVLKFPMTYGDTHSGTYAGMVEYSGGTATLSGQVNHEADGYGDLILPYTTVNNVLRVRSVDTYENSSGEIVIDTIDYWYAEVNNINLKIAAQSVNYNDGELVSSSASYVNNLSIISSNNEPDFEDASISVFPNPARDYIILENTENTLRAGIYNTSGQFIRAIDVQNGKHQLSVADLASGVYFIRYVKDARSYAKKLVIE